jgi:hypothetical protein
MNIYSSISHAVIHVIFKNYPTNRQKYALGTNAIRVNTEKFLRKERRKFEQIWLISKILILKIMITDLEAIMRLSQRKDVQRKRDELAPFHVAVLLMLLHSRTSQAVDMCRHRAQQLQYTRAREQTHTCDIPSISTQSQTRRAPSRVDQRGHDALSRHFLPALAL